MLLLAAAAAPGPGDVAHVDASLSVDGRILAVGASDVDALPGAELTVALYDRAARRRELRVYHLTPQGREADPYLTVDVKSDVIAWCWANVRPEPGKELVFITRSGAWAYATSGQGYRDLLKLVDAELLYDVSDPGELPRWPYVLPGHGADTLLLPGTDGYALWSGKADGSPYQRGPVFEQKTSKDEGPAGNERRRGTLEVTAGGVRMSRPDGKELALDHRLTLPDAFLVQTRSSINAPALLDVDGDGFIDLVTSSAGQLVLHLGGPDGIPAEPTRTESWGKLLGEDGDDADLWLHDLDGDGDLDILARRRAEKQDNRESNRETSLFVLIHQPGRMLPPAPQQILKFLAADLKPSVSDVDGDGLPDLVISKLVAPSMLELTTPDGLKVTRSIMVFRGQGKGRFSKRPDTERQDVFDMSSLGGALGRRALSMDLDGDGLADLVDTDLFGNTVVHRLKKESGFFSGTSFQIETTPWRRFEGLADMETTRVEDLNGDGLGDVLSYRGKRLTLLLSNRTGARK